MSKIKELVAVHEKYAISVEHILNPAPAVKAKLTILGDNNTFTRQVTTLPFSGATLEEAEEKAVNNAISMVLGNKETGALEKSMEMFDITFADFAVDRNGTLGVRCSITTFKGEKPYRTVVALGTGTDLHEAGKKSLKNAVNKVMGVK